MHKTAEAELRKFITGFCHSLDDAFRLLDVRCAGQLRQEDFLQGLQVLGYSGDVRDAFQDIDADSDGIVSFEEFAEYFKADSGGRTSPSKSLTNGMPLPSTSVYSATATSTAFPSDQPRQHHAAPVLQSVRSDIGESLREEVERAVSEAFSHMQQGPQAFQYAKFQQNLQAPAQQQAARSMASNDIRLKETVEGMREQMLDFAYTMSSFTEEMDRAKERLLAVEEQCSGLLRDCRSTTILARRAVDTVAHTKEDCTRLDAELTTTEAALKQELSEFKASLEAQTLNCASLEQSVCDDKMFCKLLFDNNAFVSLRLDNLQRHINDGDLTKLTFDDAQTIAKEQNTKSMTSPRQNGHDSSSYSPPLSGSECHDPLGTGELGSELFETVHSLMGSVQTLPGPPSATSPVSPQVPAGWSAAGTQQIRPGPQRSPSAKSIGSVPLPGVEVRTTGGTVSKRTTVVRKGSVERTRSTSRPRAATMPSQIIGIAPAQDAAKQSMESLVQSFLEKGGSAQLPGRVQITVPAPPALIAKTQTVTVPAGYVQAATSPRGPGMSSVLRADAWRSVTSPNPAFQRRDGSPTLPTPPLTLQRMESSPLPFQTSKS